MKSIASLLNDSVVVGCKEGGVFTYNTDGYKITDMQSKPHKGDANDIIKVDDNTFATAGGNTINIYSINLFNRFNNKIMYVLHH